MRGSNIVPNPSVSLPFLIVAAAFSSSAAAQTRSSVSADASVVILRAASAEQAEPLDFGRVLPSATGGVLTLSPDGALSCTGGMICASRGQAARFRLSGSDDVVAIGISESVALAGPGGESVALRPLVSAREVTLRGGTGDLSIGGTLTIAGNQAPGAYTGRYVLDLQYQ